MRIKKINQDERGEIWKIESRKKTIFLSKTFKDFARGGDIHRGKQFNCVIEGSFRVLMKYPDKEKEIILKGGNLAIIPKEIPHVFIALEDSVMIEWHQFPLPPFKEKRYYEPYRRKCLK